MLSTYLFLFRAVLFEILVLALLDVPEAALERQPWIVLGSYAVGAAGLFWAGRRRTLPEFADLAFFLLDIFATAYTLRWIPGASSHFYVAYFLVILGSCFLPRLSYSFIVGGMACLVYGWLSMPGTGEALESGHLLRLSLLLCTALFSAYILDNVRRLERAKEDARQNRMAWMERLSLVGKAMSGVIHELKSPMGTIVLSAEVVQKILDRPGSRAEAFAQLEVIKDEAERAGCILAEFLNFARPAELELKPMPLQVPLRKVFERLAVRMEDADVRFESRLEESTVIAGSEPHLIQVFMNLLGNAIDAMPMGRGTLTVTERRRGNQVDILVRDTGVGIDPEMIGRIFEAFETTKAAGRGHGIGLYVARWIMHKHGGDIRLRSEGHRRGTEVAVTFPLWRN